MLSELKFQLWMIGNIIRHEISFDLRLIRTWVFILAAALIGLTNILDQSGTFAELSTISSSLFIFSPLFMPMSAYPDFQLLTTLGLVFLAFDLASRDHSAQIDEVVGSLPVRNTQIVFGRAIGIVAILGTMLVAFSVLHYIASYTLALIAPALGVRPPEPIGVVSTWVVDAIPYLLFWTSTVMLVTMVVRYRVIAAAIVISLMLLMYWLQNNAPMNLLNFIGTYSLNTQLQSFLAPVFATETIVWQRVALVALACGLLMWTAVFYPRLEVPRAYVTMGFAALVTINAIVGFGYVHVRFNEEQAHFENWLRLHSQFAQPPQFEFVTMSGVVAIDPSESITINLDLRLRPKATLGNAGDLILSLNPAYEISKLHVDGKDTDYSFNNGLLLIEPPENPSEQQDFVVSIHASGNPNPKFAYLSAALSPYEGNALHGYGLVLLGKASFINHSDYVALMPAVAWYPLPGSHIGRHQIDTRAADFFHVELLVSIPPAWHLGGPGTTQSIIQNNQQFQKIKPQPAVHEVGLFAAPFDRRLYRIGDYEFELLVDTNANDVLEALHPALPHLTVQIQSYFDEVTDSGFEFSYETYTIVHSPSYLRTYGGGSAMASTSSLPGIFLLREGTFFDANFPSLANAINADRELTETEKGIQLANAVVNYFRNDIMGGNLLNAACQSVFAYQTQPKGDQATRLLGMLDYLAEQLVLGESSFYSIYAVRSVNNLLLATLHTRGIADGRLQQNLNEFNYTNWVKRPDIYDALFASSSSDDLLADEWQQLHANELFSRTMGDLIFAWFGREQTARLLTTLVDQYQYGSFTYDQFHDTAEDLGMPLLSLFGDWSEQIQPAGFLVGTGSTHRLTDTPDGTPVYEFSFPVRNDEHSAGVFVVQYQFNSERDTSDNPWIATEPVRLFGKRSLEVSVHTQQPIQHARLRPYFSLNREAILIPQALPAQVPVKPSEPKPFTQPSNWTWPYDDVILVDDLDSSFSTKQSIESERRTPKIQMIMFSEQDPARIRFDQGIRVFEPGYADTTQMWTRQQVPTAFGKYRRTLIRGNGNQTLGTARFSTELPNNGNWTLHFHLPLSNADLARSEITPAVLFDVDARVGWEDFDITIIQTDKRLPVPFDGSTMRAGWNALGNWNLSSGTTEVSVSSRSTHGPVIADAIYWRQEPL